MSMSKDEINAALAEAAGYVKCSTLGVYYIEGADPIGVGLFETPDYTDPANFAKLLELERKVYGDEWNLNMYHSSNQTVTVTAETETLVIGGQWYGPEPHARAECLALVIRRQKTTPDRA